MAELQLTSERDVPMHDIMYYPLCRNTTPIEGKLNYSYLADTGEEIDIFEDGEPVYHNERYAMYAGTVYILPGNTISVNGLVGVNVDDYSKLGNVPVLELSVS